MKTNVVTRFPPSPTGYMQIGNIRTALFNYLYAKKNGGKFVVRIEDTDRERSKPEYEKSIFADLDWLGFEYANVERQSDRTSIYRRYLDKLIDEKKAYVSEETAEEGKRGSVIRFRNPGTSITFTDAIRGEITIDPTDLGDFVIAKSLDEPLYHLAVVIDDFEMGVTHVIRGEDHISNTPRQILLLRGIGGNVPIYAHLPLVLAPDHTKLSKRNGSVSLGSLREQGYLKEAVINFLALLGWNPGTDQELFTLDELVDSFELSGIQKSGGIFNIERLNWFNREYIKRLPIDELMTHIEERLSHTPELIAVFAKSPAACLDLSARISTLGEITSLADSGEFAYYTSAPAIDPQKILWKSETALATKKRLEEIEARIAAIREGEFFADVIKKVLLPYAEMEGKGAVLWPMRYALSGKDRSPDPFTIAEAIGRNETLIRLKYATDALLSI
jgi:glutamyl-tRNA synthetase